MSTAVQAEAEARARIQADLAAGKIDQEQADFLVRWLEETIAEAHRRLAERQKRC